MGILAEEDERRKLVDCALEAARKRLSSQTGFLHLFTENPSLLRQDTIPVVENFYYILSLFRSKTVENIQEGRALIERLLPFACSGNFPIYLHEYPLCKDGELSSHLLPPLFYLLKDFMVALGEELSHKLRTLQSSIILYLQERETLSLPAKSRLLATLGEFTSDSWKPEGPAMLAEWCICMEMMGLSIQEVVDAWDPYRAVFIGSASVRYQEGYEPAVTLFDLYMAEYYKKWPAKVMEPHLIHLRGSIIQPIEKHSITSFDKGYSLLIEKEKRQCLTLYFGDISCTHSFTIEAKKGKWEQIIESDGRVALTYLPEETLPSEEESQECALYVDAHPDISLYVSGTKATTFREKEEISIHSCFGKIAVSFEGERGDWVGHILKGNRSFQKKTEGYSAYDWKIGFRTLRRSSDSKVKIYLHIQR